MTAGRRRIARPLLSVLLLAASFSPIACAPEPERSSGPTADSASVPFGYAEEIETWQGERSASLQAADGWLSLVGLHWLEPGENTFGSGEEDDLVFPAGTPGRMGTVRLEGGAVTLTAAEGAGLGIAVAEGGEPEPVEPGVSVPLVVDTAGEPTVVEQGSLSFHVIERGGRYGLRVKDPEGPARRGFVGLEFYPVDPAWRVAARLEREEGMTVAIPNVLGQVEDVRAPGVLVFRAPGGEELRVTPMQGAPGEALFVVFGDETNGRGTYGGGRFVYADPPAEGSDVVVLDFNRAYNPPCAFTPYATCPLPPDENDLDVLIEAGEKSYAGEIPH